MFYKTLSTLSGMRQGPAVVPLWYPVSDNDKKEAIFEAAKHSFVVSQEIIDYLSNSILQKEQ